MGEMQSLFGENTIPGTPYTNESSPYGETSLMATTINLGFVILNLPIFYLSIYLPIYPSIYKIILSVSEPARFCTAPAHEIKKMTPAPDI